MVTSSGGRSHIIRAVDEERFAPSFIAELSLAQAALDYARERHRGQRRESDAAPFILHPLEVAALLYNSGHTEAVVAAGILHDTIEDSPASSAEISERFGPEIARLVTAMTEDTSLDAYAERKAALRRQIAGAGPDATAVYAADKVTRVRELRARLTAEPDILAPNSPARARLDHYTESLLMLEAVTPGHPLVRQLRFELEALSALPPAPRS